MAKKFLVPVILAEGSVGSPGLYFGADTTTGIYRTTTNQIGFTVSGTNRLNVHAGGADVTGILLATSTSGYQAQVVSRHVGSTVGSGPYFIMDRTRAAAAAVVSGDTIGTILWRGWDGSAYVNGPYLLGVIDGTVSAGVVPTALTFVAGGTERARFDSAGKFIVGMTASKFYGGSFQVGTQASIVAPNTASTSFLYVCSNTALDTGSPTYQLASIQYHGSAEAGNLTYCPTVAKALAAEFGVVNSNAMVFTTNNAAPMVFATNAVERFRIGATGTVTVGVKGTAAGVRLEACDGVNEGGQIDFGGAAANADVSIDNYAGNLRIITGAGEVLRVNQAGNIGQGTTPAVNIRNYVARGSSTGAYGEYGVYATSNVNTVRGAYPTYSNVGLVQTLTGFTGTGDHCGLLGQYNNANSGLTVSRGCGVYGLASSGATGTITTLVGVMGVVDNSGAATVSNGLCFYAPNNTVGAFNVAYHTDMLAGTGKWAFYNAGTAPSYFGGPVKIAGTSKTDGYFDAGTTAPTNTTRLNYDGYLYATRFYGDGSQLTSVTATDKSKQDFRLTLTTAVPVTTSDVTLATTIYCTPYKGNQIGLYTGGAWVTRSSAQFSLALGTLTSAKPYDVFCYDNAGTPTLEFLAWTDGTTRATALAYQDGILVKSGDSTRRYLGTFYTTSTTQTEDSVANRYLWNYYNRVARPMSAVDITDTWTYTTATWREARATTTNRLNFVIGYAEDVIAVDAMNVASNSTVGPTIHCGIGLDSTSALVAGSIVSYVPSAVANQAYTMKAEYKGVPAAGVHYAARLERSQASGTTTWYGDGDGTVFRSGIHGVMLG